MPCRLLGVLAASAGIRAVILALPTSASQGQFAVDNGRVRSSRAVPWMWPPPVFRPINALAKVFSIRRPSPFPDHSRLPGESYGFHRPTLPPTSPAVNRMHLPRLGSMTDFRGHHMPLIGRPEHAFLVNEWTRTPMATQFSPHWLGRVTVDNSLMDDFIGRLQRGEVNLNNLRSLTLAETDEPRVHAERPLVSRNRDHVTSLRSAASLVTPEFWRPNDPVRFDVFIAQGPPPEMSSKLQRLGGRRVHGRYRKRKSHRKRPFVHELSQPQHHSPDRTQPPMEKGEPQARVHRPPHYLINQTVIPTPPPTESTSGASETTSEQAPGEQEDQSTDKKDSTAEESAPSVFPYELLPVAKKPAQQAPATAVASTTKSPQPKEASDEKS